MSQSPTPKKTVSRQQTTSHTDRNSQADITDEIIKTIHDECKEGLKTYPIRKMVEQAQEFGSYLRKQGLDTNQVRKFLDAINRIEAELVQDSDLAEIDPSLFEHAQAFGTYLKQQKVEDQQIRQFLRMMSRLQEFAQADGFAEIETEVVLLKPKLAYAAARQKAAKPLNDVISVAIDQVHSREDFDRLVQFIESIIAYHKAEGGR
jgi:CRISPR-associated protein Csm2